jgi:hypothetical protein
MALTKRKYIRKTPKMPPSNAAQGPTFADEADEALGIGVDDEAAPSSDIGGVDMAKLMAHPAFAAAIESIVEARLKQAAPAPASTGSTGSEAAFNAFLSKFDHMLEVQAEQRPGYIKPLSADEVDARARGKRDMFALLKQFKAEGVWPHYLLLGSENEQAGAFYGPSPNGPMIYQAGQEIKTRLPPAETFQPLNEPAVRVFEAYKRWVGEVIPVDELIAQAAAAARGQSNAPEVEHETRTLDPEVMVVDVPKREVGPKRVLGTITPELRGKPMPGQPNVVAQPTGPIFVGENA